MIKLTYDEKIAEVLTEKQLVVYKAHCLGKKLRDIAKETNTSTATVHGVIKAIQVKATKKGLMDAYCPEKGAGAGRIVQKATTHVKDGKVQQEWIRTDLDAEQALRNQEIICEILRDQAPLKAGIVKAPIITNDEYLSAYIMGDPHLGMYAWAEESGEDFDCDICEAQIVEGIDQLVEAQTPSEQAVIINVGDFYHSDNEEGVTTASGNHLDCDGRWGRVLRIGVRMMTHCIDRALEKHQTVRVINAMGNHDDKAAYMLSITLDAYYRNEPRVEIDTKYCRYHYVEFGKVLIGVNHGMVKPQVLYNVMTSDMPEAWGRTEHRFFHVGHIHHKTATEIGGMTVESHRSLKAKDAYEHAKGYRAGRDIKSILYHKTGGEAGRNIRNVAMLKSYK